MEGFACKNCSVITDKSEAEVGVYVMLDGKTQQITHQSGTIVSHRGYSHKRYPRNVNSTLRIEVPHGILLLTVRLTALELESRHRQDGCYDFLKIKGQTYCGSEIVSNWRMRYVSATESLSLEFHTDWTSPADGFLLEYKYWTLSLSKFQCCYGSIIHRNSDRIIEELKLHSLQSISHSVLESP